MQRALWRRGYELFGISEQLAWKFGLALCRGALLTAWRANPWVWAYTFRKV